MPPQPQQVSFPFALYPAAKADGHARVEQFGDSFHVLVRRFTGAKDARTEVAPLTGTFTIAQVTDLRDRLQAQQAAVEAVLADMAALST